VKLRQYLPTLKATPANPITRLLWLDPGRARTDDSAKPPPPKGFLTKLDVYLDSNPCAPAKERSYAEIE